MTLRRGALALLLATMPLVGSSAATQRGGLATPRRAANTAPRGSAIPRLQAFGWREHTYTTATGEPVDVNVSRKYADAETVGQQWANFFAGLVHGAELRLLKAYIAPAADVRTICGNPLDVGCYLDNELVTSSDPVNGVDPKEVARHEYGHHIAFNRANFPFPNAVAWGTRRWATYEHVCARVRSGRALVGDEFLLYRQNPGEAFAETYRILNDLIAGQTNLTWTLADRSYYPDAGSLAAVEHDVLSPWTGQRVTTIAGRFPGRQRTWTYRLRTPLDGTLSVRLARPPDASYRLSLRSSDGRTLMVSRARSHRELTLDYDICGQRALVIRVTGDGAARVFPVNVTRP